MLGQGCFVSFHICSVGTSRTMLNDAKSHQSLQKVLEHQACSSTGDVAKATSFVAKWRSLGRRLRKVTQSYAKLLKLGTFHLHHTCHLCTWSFLKSSRSRCIIPIIGVKMGQGRQAMTLHHFRVAEACRSRMSTGLLYERCGPLLLGTCRRARHPLRG